MLDFCLMQTVAVTVAHREQVGMDAYAAPVYRLVEEVVEGCLVEPGATADLDASRPEGVTAALRVHFPKSYTASLRGATVTYGGRSYPVVGDPAPYMPANSPGPWNRTVECGACDG